MEDFVDRESQFPNRRRLEIVSQTPNEIIADIYREEGNVSESGTPITAQMLNDMKNEFANQGTTIKINDQAQASVTFTSDPQSQINNKANLDAGNLTNDNINSWQNKLNQFLTTETATALNEEIGTKKHNGQAVVIETFISSDGLTWYRKWSDGWKECGTYNPNMIYETTVALPLEFSNTKYTLVNVGLRVWNHAAANLTKTTSSFTLVSEIQFIGTYGYYACGY